MLLALSVPPALQGFSECPQRSPLRSQSTPSLGVALFLLLLLLLLVVVVKEERGAGTGLLQRLLGLQSSHRRYLQTNTW